jgi:hypothetical protein
VTGGKLSVYAVFLEGAINITLGQKTTNITDVIYGPHLTESPIYNITNGMEGTWIEFTFLTPYEIQAGQEYWIGIHPIGPVHTGGVNVGLGFDDATPGNLWGTDYDGMPNDLFSNYEWFTYPEYSTTGYDGYQIRMNLTYESQELISEPTPEPAPEIRHGNNAFFVQQNLAKQATQTVNPIEQFILNLRAWLLGIFGIKG